MSVAVAVVVVIVVVVVVVVEWFLVYQYLTALLHSDELPDIGQIGAFRCTRVDQ